MDTAQLKQYLERIQYTGSLDVSVETLRGLHIAHTFHIPFENFDIHLGRPISLEPNALFEKIVTHRRGGYCYEMNGLFVLVLEALGFEVQRLMARIMAGYTETRPLTHQLSLITIGSERWIADVGNGRSGLVAPLKLENHVPERQFGNVFRLHTTDEHNFILQSEVDSAWTNVYGFTLEPYLPVDYIPANHYNSTSPESRFLQHKICTMPTAEGRVSVVDMEFRIQANGQTEVYTASDDADYRAMLQRYFGIILDGTFVR